MWGERLIFGLRAYMCGKRLICWVGGLYVVSGICRLIG